MTTMLCRAIGFYPVGQWWGALFEYRCEEHPAWLARHEGIVFVHLQQHGWENRDINEALEKMHLAAVSQISTQTPTITARLVEVP